MKKKVFNIMFLGVALTSLSACSNGNSDSSAKSENQNSVVKVEESSSSELKEIEDSSKASEANSKYFDLMIEAAQSQLPVLKEQMGDMYSDITITSGAEHTIIYTYTLSENPVVDLDMEALKPVLIKGIKSVNDPIKNIIPDAKFQMIYLRPDKTELGNMVITQEDIEAIQVDSAEL
ncbi:hypothetical protein [Candidatus Enterococcus murrayae]|uniref:Lipoprotein n=1 Tax=Candidatus Enterococcus murrayae TaxID=2815321 RepID=A0ABS3HDW2_9ENTE|nr:hypothetical protein [Enterococcus sp. MJM16]MBO0451187.1 hypothetical protein [Enterococcus sp. MJM16]